MTDGWDQNMQSNAHDQRLAGTRGHVVPASVVNSNHAATNGVWRNLGICHSHCPPDEIASNDYRAMVEHVIQSNTGSVGILTVIESASTPTPEGRNILVGTFRDLWPQLAAAAFVVRGKGFTAATQRSILSAFLMASGLRSRLRIYSTLDDAIPWLAYNLADSHVDMTEADLSSTMRATVDVFLEEHAR